MTVLLTLEGLEGASKSTSIRTIQRVFSEHNQRLFSTREPGGTLLAEQLRDMLKADWDEPISSDTELLMFFASRMQSYHNVVLPALKNSHVILDRSLLSTFAYQVYQRQSPELFDFLAAKMMSIQPFHAILYLDVDPEVGLLRARGRGKLDRIEKMDLSFFQRAREGYRHIVSTFPRATTIDANGTEEVVQAAVAAWAESLVKQIQTPAAALR